MKKLILAISILASSSAFGGTDYTCQQNCLNSGYTYQLCSNKCSYNDNYNTIKQTDYQCLSDCTNKGYMYNYCTSRCSY